VQIDDNIADGDFSARTTLIIDETGRCWARLKNRNDYLKKRDG